MQFFVRAARRQISEILQFLCAILAQRLRDLDAKRALFRNGTQRRLGQLQRRFFEYAQRSLAGFTQFLCARRAGNPEILQFFRATLAQNLRDIDARRAIFSHLDALPIRSRAEVMLFGSRSACWPISGNFSARGAPRFWEFCNDFARVLRKICVTSARHSGFF